MATEINVCSSTVSPLPLSAPIHPITQRLLDAFQYEGFSWCAQRALTKEFKVTPPDELLTILDAFFDKITQIPEESIEAILDKCKHAESLENFKPNNTEENLFDAQGYVEFMAAFAELIPLDKLQSILKNKFANEEEALLAARKMLGAAKFFLLSKDKAKGASKTLHENVISVLNGILSFLDSFFGAFGVADFFRPADNEIRKEFKFQKIMMLIGLFTLLTATLLPMLGVTQGSSIVGGSLLLIAILSVIYPKIRPDLGFISEGEVWTKSYQSGDLTVLGGREVQVREIAQTLVTTKKTKIVREHILVTGPSGIGKTELLKNLVETIERGDFPELNGMQVVYFNAGDLVNSREMFGGGNRSLEKIKELIKNQENVILIFDEIHLLFQNKKTAVIAGQLKSLLDKQFKYVIGVTTEEEFVNIYENESAFLRRFSKPLRMTNTEPSDTIAILNNFFTVNADNGVLLKKGTLEYLLEQTKDQPQPLTALKVLTRAILKTSSGQQWPLANEIQKLQQKKRSSDAETAVALFSDPHEDSEAGLEKLEKDFLTLKKEWKKQKRERAHLLQLREVYAETKKVIFQKVEELSNTKKESALKIYLFLSQFFGPRLEKEIEKQSNEQRFHTIIDQNLIETVVKEHKHDAEELQKTATRGRKTLTNRKVSV